MLSSTESDILSIPFYFTFKWENPAQGTKGRMGFSREIKHNGIREVRETEHSWGDGGVESKSEEGTCEGFTNVLVTMGFSWSIILLKTQRNPEFN